MGAAPGRARPGCAADRRAATRRTGRSWGGGPRPARLGAPNRPAWTTSGQLPPWPAGGGTRAWRRRRGGPAQGDDADDAAVVGGSPNASWTSSWPSGGTPKNRPPRPSSTAVEQHQQRRHAGVDVPVRHRPAGLVPVGPALVRLGVAVEVGRLVGAAQHQHRRCCMPASQRVRLVVGVGGRRPEALALRRLAEHDEVPALAEAGAGRPAWRCAGSSAGSRPGPAWSGS